MTESREMKCMRQQAWERAKGELNSVICTYYNDPNFDAISVLIEDLIYKIDNKGLVD